MLDAKEGQNWLNKMTVDCVLPTTHKLMVSGIDDIEDIKTMESVAMIGLTDNCLHKCKKVKVC